MSSVISKHGPWPIESSSHKGEYYNVYRKNSGRLACECTGYHYRMHCKHIPEAVKKYGIEENVGPASLFLAACNYQLKGYCVLPIFPGDKRPMVNWKIFHEEKNFPTIGNLADWWTITPDANVGIVLGKNSNGFFPLVLDLDGGEEAEALLLERDVILPLGAPRSKTPSGFHVFLTAPNPIADRIGILRGTGPREDGSRTPAGKPRHAQVDIRGQGIIVMPPSIHPNGDVYHWITELQDGPPPMIVQPLRELIGA